MANELTDEQEFLKDNPDATAYDMFIAGVINQARYDEMTALGEDTKQTPAEFAKNKRGGQGKTEPKQTQSVSDFRKSKQAVSRAQSVQDFLKSADALANAGTQATPPQGGSKLRPTGIVTHRNVPSKLIKHEVTNSNQVVWLTNKKTGKTTSVSRGSAERQLRKYPQLYKIS